MFDDLVSRLAKIHYDDHFVAGLVGQHDVAHGSAVDAAHAHIGAGVEALDVIELRFQLIGRAEKILLAADDEDPAHQDRQGRNDEKSQPRRSRHL